EPLAWWKRGLGLATAIAGISAIYLSHVRASLLVTLGMIVAYVAMLIIQRQRQRAWSFAALSIGLIVSGFSLATILGGTSVQERFAALVQEDPRAIYYKSRGNQLESVFDTMAEYPLGAGLARWGMINNYFADRGNLDSSSLWAEVQPNAWVLDGGLFLLVL